MRCDYNFNSPVWNLISDDAKDFVSSLIVLNPKERLNAKEALEHQWFTNVAALSSEVPPAELMEGIEASLMNYANASELKKLALNVIAHKSSAEEIVMMRTAFSHFDAESDGYITFEEFRNALKECNLDDGTLNKVYNSMDVNKNGTVSYTEFLAAVLEARSNIDEERVADAFDRLDSDDTGYISKQDLASLLGRDKDSEDVQRLIREADTDQDGQSKFVSRG
jgi:Ca2+-binding EF-hand superfamily protein